MSHWMIVNRHEYDDDFCPLFWSNIDGWVPYASGAWFTDTEHDTLTLPDRGEWVHITGGHS
jgi:hypothetical protein